MKVMLVALALLALAASAASTHTCGCGGWQPPHLPHLPPPPRPQHPCPCQPHGTCVGGGTPTPPILGQCLEFLRYQCISFTATPHCSPHCQVLRQQCCQEIRQVEPLHQHHAIYGVVLQYMSQLPIVQVPAAMATQLTQQLAAMCGLQGPGPCPCRAAGGGVQY